MWPTLQWPGWISSLVSEPASQQGVSLQGSRHPGSGPGKALPGCLHLRPQLLASRPAPPGSAALRAHQSPHPPTHPPTLSTLPAVEERSFHGGSRHLALLIALVYCIWLLVVRHNFGKVRPRLTLHVVAPPRHWMEAVGGNSGQRQRTSGAAELLSCWVCPPPPRHLPCHLPKAAPLRATNCVPKLPSQHPHSPRLPQFPYPVMNKLPFPHGYLGFAAVGFAMVLGTFHLGKVVKQLTARIIISSGGGTGSTSSAGGKGKRKDQ